MDRRLLFTSLALLSAAPVLAQPVPTLSGDQRPATGGSDGKGPGGVERDHVMRTAMVGMMSLQASDVALQQARGAKVKEFAKFEHDEQTTVADVLMSLDPDIKPPAPDQKGTEMMRRMKEAGGAAFDRMYVTGQIEAHQMLLTAQEDYLKSGSMSDHTSVAKLVRGMVKEHLVLLADLHASLR